jgi:Ca2+-binding RTX toxin-like protein
MATLIVTATHDYTGDILNNIDEITFNTSGFAQASFFPSQFGGSGISNSVHITGDANQNWVAVYMPAPGTFSAAGWSFSNWTYADTVSILGSSGADTITGSSSYNSIRGGPGADTLIGGASYDGFWYEPGDIAAGETVDGGAETDTVMIESIVGGNTYDISDLALTSIESLGFNWGTPGGSAAAILSGAEIGAGAITNVFGANIFTNTLIVNGSSVDLSAVTFTNWTAGTDIVTINGTAGANNLTGSSQNDKIKGGLGADHMTGWAGDDIYFIGQPGDVVDESLAGSSGIDTVRSSISFSLADAVHAKGSIEKLILTGGADINGTGNGGANVIIGNKGDNIINGGGDHDEIFGGGGADHLAGGGSNDLVWGGAGNDILRAGVGYDALNGGVGNDAFVFSAALALTSLGVIIDFLPGHDIIKLKHTVFTKIAIGALAADAFHTGANAADKEDRIIYHQASDSLYYDADGTGPQAKMLFATIENDAVLSATDFVVFA